MEAAQAAEGAADVERALGEARAQAAWLDARQAALEAEIEAYEDLVVQAKALKEKVRSQKQERRRREREGTADKDYIDDRPTALVDLGCGVFSRARIDQPERLSVSIGAGVYVDLDIDEVDRVANRRISLLREELSNWMKQKGNVHGHERILLEAQQILQYVSGLSADGRGLG